ncbi:MAG: hypothetical protein ACE5Z5_03725 [Candidatus Bathyarchaeia archaeon]
MINVLNHKIISGGEPHGKERKKAIKPMARKRILQQPTTMATTGMAIRERIMPSALRHQPRLPPKIHAQYRA